MIELWTIQMSSWRIAKARDIFLLDVTAMSGHPPFAPEFNYVRMYKRGELSEEGYTRLYLEKMAFSQERYPKYWENIEKKGVLALACYCKAGAFCHRILLVDIIIDYYKKKGIEVKYMGEITKD